MQFIRGSTQKESGSPLKKSQVASLLRSWPYKCLLATYTISCCVGRGYQLHDAEDLLLNRPGHWLSISEVLASHVP